MPKCGLLQVEILLKVGLLSSSRSAHNSTANHARLDSHQYAARRHVSHRHLQSHLMGQMHQQQWFLRLPRQQWGASPVGRVNTMKWVHGKMTGATADGREGRGRVVGKQWNTVFLEEGEKRVKARNEPLDKSGAYNNCEECWVKRGLEVREKWGREGGCKRKRGLTSFRAVRIFTSKSVGSILSL